MIWVLVRNKDEEIKSGRGFYGANLMLAPFGHNGDTGWMIKEDAILLCGMGAVDIDEDELEILEQREIADSELYSFIVTLLSTGADLSEDIFKVGNYVWDKNLLEWIRMEQPLLEITGGNFTIEMDEVENLLTAIKDTDGIKKITDPVQTIDTLYALRTDDNGAGTIYIGQAAVGSGESSSVWRIKKVVESSGDYTITWADGNTNFDNRWDQRASYSYS